MALSGKPHFLQKKVLGVGIEDVKCYASETYLSSSQSIEIMWVEILWEAFLVKVKTF